MNINAARQQINDLIDWNDPTQELYGVQLRELLDGYTHRWSEETWSVDAIEQYQRVRLRNPKTGYPSRRFEHAGKVDGLIRDDSGRLFILEHKTTTSDIGPDAKYWSRLAIDSQVSKYCLQNAQLGEMPVGCLYDVVRRPMTRPKKLSKANQQEIIDSGTYLGEPVPIATRNIVDDGNDRETPMLYGLRLRTEIASDPDAWFQRRMIYRTEDEIVEYAQELWSLAGSINDARQQGASGYYRNTTACLSDYGRPCAYLGICSGHDDPESDNWFRDDCRHPELAEDMDDDGLDVITNSAANCFQQCRRKYFYRYESGLRRKSGEDSDALFFGSLWHQVQERWWEEMRG